ncbi:Glycosyl hydrolases family 43 [Chitinophaga rupis]|uniref:Glycosyl hydrolases family 43 n=1 Tax=Chitinophaga rupis TaxID=573321 RepID=A0A1H7V512_9BACT|nr:glycoside hydrolase family 43 protein [Chitinophaga rupis]SEM04286.1 Glycosyl hydrolases family 43 [Chitinophaga rupis]
MDNKHQTPAGNPVIRHKFTADPAAIVFNDKVYMYTGHDEAPPGEYKYVMNEWLCFSSTDMVNWTEHPIPLKAADFKWVKGGAWASQVIERHGKFFWYVAVEHNTIPGRAIGVAVADRPEGPYKDARGSALVSNDMTTFIDSDKDDIDPTVIIDDDGQAYLFWGNGMCYYAKLKENMTELDGEIKKVDLPDFSEGAWIHKQGSWYYLLYGYQFPEKVAYAMSRSIHGPWEFKGIVNEIAGNCQTNSPALLEYKGLTYFIYHNGGLPPHGDSYRRSVCIDYLFYNADGTLKRVQMTSEGVVPVK